jgi:hypothetical protein
MPIPSRAPAKSIQSRKASARAISAARASVPRGGHVVADLQQVGGHFLAGKDRPPRLAATVQHTRGAADGGGISRRQAG